ncbi:MAG TPA: polysaccharide lyase family 7 protein [Candidatus Sulfotelmatobacter sp.]|nr:polysaccharide lyase family 7 protein [Candidatus Sulfotelmatobacter sp.]
MVKVSLIFGRLPFCCGLIIAFMAMGARAQIDGGGWSPCPVTFQVQSPTNAARDRRYWFTNGIYHCEVFDDDAAFAAGNTTRPRTEQRFTPDYRSGEVQYQAMEMAPSNENSYCIFQIHTGNAATHQHGATTFMLFWFSSDGGSVHDYSGRELASHMGDQWFQLNVDHNLATRTIRAWINQKLVWTQRDNGAGDFYFKDGVYEQRHNPTSRMDAYIKDIHLWVRAGTAMNTRSQPEGAGERNLTSAN